MYRFIGIEDLAANALIELLEKSGCRRVDFETLLKYGNMGTVPVPGNSARTVPVPDTNL